MGFVRAYHKGLDRVVVVPEVSVQHMPGWEPVGDEPRQDPWDFEGVPLPGKPAEPEPPQAEKPAVKTTSKKSTAGEPATERSDR